MSKYNIIYTSPGQEHYLWNGFSLDQLEKTGQEALAFSGRNFKAEEIADAIEACRGEVSKLFPKDTPPEIKAVEIAVSE